MIFTREFKSNLSKLFAWIIVLAILIGLLMAIYPIIMDGNMKSIFDSFLESLSDGVKNVLGFHKDLDYTKISDYIGFIFQYVAVFTAIFAMQLGSSSLSREQADGAIEYIYSNPISRTEILTYKFLSNIFTYLIMMICLGVITFLMSLLIGSDLFGTDITISTQVVVFSILKALLGVFLSGIVFLIFGTFLSAFSRSVSFTEATAVLFVILSVIVAVFGKVYGGTFKNIVDNFTLEVFNPVLFVKEQISIVGIGINLAVAIVFLMLAYLIYNIKELDY